MTKIHERYINDAVRIRKTYLKTLSEISDLETIITKYKNEIVEIIEKNDVFVEKNQTKNLDFMKSEMKNDLEDIDCNINKIVKKIEPLLKNIDQLKKETSILYTTIKDKYPNLSEHEIQQEVLNHIKQ